MDLEEAPTLKVMPDDPDEDAPPKQKPAVPIYTEERVLEIQVLQFTHSPRRFRCFVKRLQRDSTSSSKLNRFRFNLFSSETQRHVAFGSPFFSLACANNAGPLRAVGPRKAANSAARGHPRTPATHHTDHVPAHHQRGTRFSASCPVFLV
jgi:hypothetical protein